MVDTNVSVVVPGNRITLLDIVKANGSDGVVGLVDETIRAHPEVMVGAARTIKGINYKTLIRKSLGSVAFRDFNSGSGVVKATYDNQLIETFLLNPRIEADKAVADAAEDGAEAYISMEATAVMEASMQLLGRQFYYGRRTAENGDLKGHPGLLDYVDPAFVYPAGGSSVTTSSGSATLSSVTVTGIVVGMQITATGVPVGTLVTAVGTNTVTMSANATATGTVSGTFDGCSSVYFVAFGQNKVQWVFGNNGQMAMAPTRIGDIFTPDGGHVTGYISELEARPGLQCLNRYSIVRIQGLTGQAGYGLTDAKLGSALALLPAAFRHTISDIFMSVRSGEQLRASRTAVNPTGAPAPTPVDFEQIPIRYSDSISNVEPDSL